MTVENVQFDKVAPEDIKLAIGTTLVSIEGFTRQGDFKYEVRAQVNPPAPDPSKRDYEPYLVVGKSRVRIPNNPGQLLQYQ